MIMSVTKKTCNLVILMQFVSTLMEIINVSVTQDMMVMDSLTVSVSNKINFCHKQYYEGKELISKI